MKNDLSTRFIKALELLSKTAYQAAKELNTSDSNMSKIKQGRTPNAELLEKMVNLYPVNPVWLLSGKGNPISDDWKTQAGSSLINEDKTDYGSLSSKIPIYDVNALKLMEQNRQHQIDLFFQTDKIEADFALKYHGKALDPDIQSGDLLFCSKLVDLTKLIYDELYLVSSPESVFLRYVHYSGSHENIAISSTVNADKLSTYPIKNIDHIYKVVALYRTLSI
jgi:transcriptional regulator with XRE-family HTH domain